MTGKVDDGVYPCPVCILNILAMPENREYSKSQLKIHGNRVRLNGHSYPVGQLVPCRDGLNRAIILGFNNLSGCGHILTLIEMQSLLIDLALPSLDAGLLV